MTAPHGCPGCTCPVATDPAAFHDDDCGPVTALVNDFEVAVEEAVADRRDDAAMVRREKAWDALAEALRERDAEIARLREVVAPLLTVNRVDGVDYCPFCHAFTDEHMHCGCDFGRARAALRQEGQQR